jgi:DNA-binding MarR family transcriptional regulator
MYPVGDSENHLTNTLATLSVELADQIAAATQSAVGMRGELPAAVVALSQFLDGATIQRLADVLGLTHSGTVRLVNRLEDGRLAVRKPGPDARSQSVHLTATGRKVGQKVSEARAKVIATALVDLSTADRLTLARLVDAMISTLTTSRLDARRRELNQPGWLCRLCDFAACGRAAGDCPAANTAAAWADQVQLHEDW